MGNYEDNNTDLTALEERVDELINTVNDLKTENSSLKNQQENLVSERAIFCLLYTSPSPRDRQKSRMPSSA